MRRKASIGIAVGLLGTAPVARAQSKTVDKPIHRVEWKDRPRFSTLEYAATGVLAAGTIGGSLLGSRDSSPNWRGGVLVDDRVVGFARADEKEGRARVAAVSDYFLYGMIAFPYLDAAFVATARSSPDAAMQMALINTEAFMLTGLTTTLIKMAVKRERPYVQRCDPSIETCVGNDSFLSGHTSMTFTSAGLTCAHHQALSIYGSGVADGGVCVAALGMATATGVMRIVADKHFASDVFAGAALGLASGYLMPRLLHYGGLSSSSTDVAKAPKKRVVWSAMPVPTKSGAMLSVSGAWW
jgi:membrane-associated phospholipid phosphatase